MTCAWVEDAAMGVVTYEEHDLSEDDAVTLALALRASATIDS